MPEPSSIPVSLGSVSSGRTEDVDCTVGERRAWPRDNAGFVVDEAKIGR